jgi:hypothetical protein
VVTDAQTGTPLAGATVNAYAQPSGSVITSGANIISTATTDSNGNFSLTGLLVGMNYYFLFNIPGYDEFSYFYIVPDTTILTLETIKMIPAGWHTQTATASGKVKNASTNAGLPGMTVKIRPGVNNRTGSITVTSTTDSTGAYSFTSLAAGIYTAEVTGNIGSTAIITSYFTLVSFPGNLSANTNQDFPVTTPLSHIGAGQYRIILNWGNNPSDLDSHLTGPTATSGTRFHTAYYAGSYPLNSTTTGSTGFRIAGSTTEAFLDVDNTRHGVDNGPETTTIVVPRLGLYRFYVHHFAGASTISSSGAQVKVYKGGALLQTFNPPSSSLGQDAVWSVFTMDVTSNGEVFTPVNTISMIPSTTLAKTVVSSFEEYLLFSNLPHK